MYKDFTTISTDATNVAAINQSIKNIILTQRGTLPGKPRFGSDLYKIIFSPLDPLTESMARRYITEALTEYEDRVIIENITFKREEAYNRLIIKLDFYYKDLPYGEDTNTSSLSLAINV